MAAKGESGQRRATGDATGAPVAFCEADQDFPHRPERHQRAAWRSVGIDAVVIQRGANTAGIREGRAVRQECLETALADRSSKHVGAEPTEAERREFRLQRGQSRAESLSPGE